MVHGLTHKYYTKLISFEGINTLADLMRVSLKKKKSFKILVSVEELSRNCQHYRYSLFSVYFDLSGAHSFYLKLEESRTLFAKLHFLSNLGMDPIWS